MHNKGNHKQNENTTTYGLEENIWNLSDWHGINFQNIQGFHTTKKKKKTQKNKQPNLKMSERFQ